MDKMSLKKVVLNFTKKQVLSKFKTPWYLKKL